MSLEALQKEIEKKGRDEAKSVENMAHKEASLIFDEAKKHAKSIDAQVKEAIKQEVSRLQNEYAANSDLARNTILVSARDAVVDEVFEKVRKDVAQDLRERQRKIFENAAKMAKQIGPIEKMRYVINKKDSDFVKGWKGNVEFRDMVGGVIIYSEDSKVKIDASIDTMIENNADMIKTIINDVVHHPRKSSGNAKKPKAGRSARKAMNKQSKKAKSAKSAKRISKPKRVNRAKAKRKR